MTVYIDKPRHRYAGMLMCHVTADTELELHLMMNEIGIEQRWFQGDHYDVCKTKHVALLELGAVLSRPREILAVTKRIVPLNALCIDMLGVRHLISPLNRKPPHDHESVPTFCGDTYPRNISPLIKSSVFIYRGTPTCMHCMGRLRDKRLAQQRGQLVMDLIPKVYNARK